ncbi:MULTISPECIES: hypothetical protein [unclassified Devosia]|uniref:hypothetical protein n=1 Tax=unclassified Devosia TaxID=196773 RepID=UPI001ACAD6A9|nr:MULTISPECIES: hypothetical protein [unclassified Devosia]MBN9362188.1 hypothetical protein [Devosia sp.]
MRSALSRLGGGILAAAALSVPLPGYACSINLTSAGTLRPSDDNKTLGSEVKGNTPGTVTSILSLLDGTATIEVSSPTRIQTPGGYNASAETLQVAYNAAAVLGLFPGASQSYTSSTTSFQATGVLAGLSFSITLHNRILNPNGFAPGTYTTRTVVTCHP